MGEWLPLVGGYVFIFGARVCDVSLDVVRILLLMRGRRGVAAAVGFVEVSIFVLALNQVLAGGLHDPLKVIAYASGFATGNLVGSAIENKMALGYLSVQVFPEPDLADRFACALREAGYGVTCVEGHGRSGDRTILYLLLKRGDLQRVLDILNQLDSHVFFNVSDARDIHGGVFPRKKR